MSKSKKYEDAILEAFLLRAIEAENQALQETPEEPLDEESCVPKRSRTKAGEKIYTQNIRVSCRGLDRFSYCRFKCKSMESRTAELHDCHI